MPRRRRKVVVIVCVKMDYKVCHMNWASSTREPVSVRDWNASFSAGSQYFNWKTSYVSLCTVTLYSCSAGTYGSYGMGWDSFLVSSVTACSNLCQLSLCISLPCFGPGASSHMWSLCPAITLLTVDLAFGPLTASQKPGHTIQALLKYTSRHRAQWHTCSSEAAPLVQPVSWGLCFAVFTAQWYLRLYSAGLNSAHISVPGSYQLTLGLQRSWCQ